MENDSNEDIARLHFQRINGGGTTCCITVSIWQQKFRPDIFPDGPLAAGWSIKIVEHICRCILERDHHFERIRRFDLDFDLTRILEQDIHSRLTGIAKFISIFLILKSDPGGLHDKSRLATCQQNGLQKKQKGKVFEWLFNFLLTFMFKMCTL